MQFILHQSTSPAQRFGQWLAQWPVCPHLKQRSPARPRPPPPPPRPRPVPVGPPSPVSLQMNTCVAGQRSAKRVIIASYRDQLPPARPQPIWYGKAIEAERRLDRGNLVEALLEPRLARRRAVVGRHRLHALVLVRRAHLELRHHVDDDRAARAGRWRPAHDNRAGDAAVLGDGKFVLRRHAPARRVRRAVRQLPRDGLRQPAPVAADAILLLRDRVHAHEDRVVEHAAGEVEPLDGEPLAFALRRGRRRASGCAGTGAASGLASTSVSSPVKSTGAAFTGGTAGSPSVRSTAAAAERPAIASRGSEERSTPRRAEPRRFGGELRAPTLASAAPPGQRIRRAGRLRGARSTCRDLQPGRARSREQYD